MSKQGKAVLLIDGSNTYEAARRLGFYMEYKKFLDYLKDKEGFNIIQAFYFSAVLEKKEGIRKFLNWLGYSGYRVIEKEAVEYKDGTVKGNMDIEMAVMAMELAQFNSQVILVTGDGDFSVLVDSLQKRNIVVTVISTVESTPPMCSDKLRRTANNYIDLHSIRKDVTREEKRT